MAGGYHGIHNVSVGSGSDTVEVDIADWDNSTESGEGTLANGDEVTVFQSYDGDGYLVLSDQDAAVYEAQNQGE